MIKVVASEIFPITSTILDENNNVVSGEQVNYDIRYLNDTPLNPPINGLLIESTIASGVYTNTLSISDPGNYYCYISCSGYNTTVAEIQVEEFTVAEQIWQHEKAIELINNVAFIKAIESGAWKIINDKMFFFDNDNTTETAVFELFDKYDTPAEELVYERRRLLAFCYNCILDETWEKILDEAGEYLLDES